MGLELEELRRQVVELDSDDDDNRDWYHDGTKVKKSEGTGYKRRRQRQRLSRGGLRIEVGVRENLAELG